MDQVTQHTFEDAVPHLLAIPPTLGLPMASPSLALIASAGANPSETHSEPGLTYLGKGARFLPPSLGKRRNKYTMVDFFTFKHIPVSKAFFFQAIAFTPCWKSLVRMVGKWKEAFEPPGPADTKLQPSLPRLKGLGFPKQLKTLPN